MSILRKHIRYPAVYTFKIVGDNIPEFLSDVERVFETYQGCSIRPKCSENQKYISFSVTLEVQSYEDLENIYEKIAALKHLKFHI